MFSFNHAGAIRRVINVYKDWLQEENRPVFMQDPNVSVMSPTSPTPSINTNLPPDKSDDKGSPNFTLKNIANLKNKEADVIDVSRKM